ncbi:MAG: glycosyltransferase family 2 protein, partial [Elusimicrobia bacterium]|nr:glycosyltransferase family 2 protein [Elusimicrobiota bacterium]
MISIVIPCYNESENIQALTKEVRLQMQGLGEPFEILVVDDGSTDGTLEKLRALKEQGLIQYLALSRNFGHQAALKAGLDCAQGDAVITMDGDLQHPPALLPVLVSKWREGYQVVNTVREKTVGEGFFKKTASRLFYRLFEFLSGLSLQPGSADFRLLDQKVVKELRGLSESYVFLRGIISWLGFNATFVSYAADERRRGRSKYSLKKMLVFARDGLMSFSIRPLRAAGLVGLIISAGAGLY